MYYKRGCSLVVVRCVLCVVGCVWVVNAFHVWRVGVMLAMLLAVCCLCIDVVVRCLLFVVCCSLHVFYICDGMLLVGCVRGCSLLFAVCCYLLIDG